MRNERKDKRGRRERVTERERNEKKEGRGKGEREMRERME